MRAQFDEELNELNNDLIKMGMLCETSIRNSAKPLENRDGSELASQNELLDRIHEKDRNIENICLRLLLRQQPVARDLRVVSSALKMVTDMDRIGVQSTNITEITAQNNILTVNSALPFQEMADRVCNMVTKSVDAFVKQDDAIAQSVIQYDNVIDRYFDRCRDWLTEELKKPGSNGEAMLDLLMIAKYLERIGDHAENIAKWVHFSITGILDGTEE